MSSAIDCYLLKMTEDDKHFFQELGAKISSHRKDLNLTQVQLAEILNISQQHMASFEKGARKIPASMLPVLAKLFNITIDKLLSMKLEAAKRGPTAKLQRQVEQISKLPRSKQKFVMEMLDTVIQQQA